MTKNFKALSRATEELEMFMFVAFGVHPVYDDAVTNVTQPITDDVINFCYCASRCLYKK